MITFEATQAPIPVPPILPDEPDQFQPTPGETPPHESPPADPAEQPSPVHPEPQLPRVS